LAARPVTSEEFSEILESFLSERISAVAVGVSGGPDSMALAKLLSLWGSKKRVRVHALSIDHGLRKESAKEARSAGKRMEGWSNLQHEILKWKGKKPKARMMEEARVARYDLIAQYCRKHKIKYLFLAHHQDDQAETFLLRLAGGSGLDGLAAIRPVQVYDKTLTVLRPLLGFSKERLIATCKVHKIPYLKDPSNKAQKFARPRLRKSWKILEAEGLSSKRLAVTAARIDRARRALDEMAEKAFYGSLLAKTTNRIVLDQESWCRLPGEIAFRVVLKAIRHLRPGENYLPRMEKIEDLFADLFSPKPFRKRTLGGAVFERDDRKGLVIVSAEKT
jgi:tRNA(Ile)-lysidine synthase